MWVTALLASATSCSGTDDEGDSSISSVTLSVDKTSITANGSDVATFTVKNGGNVVTSQVELRCLTTNKPVSDNKFSTTEAGTYEFQATVNGMASNKVTVVANAVVESKYLRQICVMDFTGAWCMNCPPFYRILNLLTTSDTYKDHCHLIAVHDNSEGEPNDPMEIQAGKDLISQFKITQFPQAVIDMRDVTANNQKEVTDALSRSLAEYPAHCGVAVKSVVSNGVANVTVKVTSETQDDYRLVLYVVEDNIKSPQLEATGLVNDNYNHRHVLRALASGSIIGDKLGTLTAGQEVSKEYTVTLDEAWKLKDLSFYALALDKNGYVNNMAVCAADGGDTDYILAK